MYKIVVSNALTEDCVPEHYIIVQCCVGFSSCLLCRLKNVKILRIHKKCHQGELFTCPHCDKLSSTRNNLRMHMKRHSDARPHTCPLCAHGFKTPRDLKVSWHFHSETFAAELVEIYSTRTYERTVIKWNWFVVMSVWVKGQVPDFSLLFCLTIISCYFPSAPLSY